MKLRNLIRAQGCWHARQHGLNRTKKYCRLMRLLAREHSGFKAWQTTRHDRGKTSSLRALSSRGEAVGFQAIMVRVFIWALEGNRKTVRFGSRSIVKARRQITRET